MGPYGMGYPSNGLDDNGYKMYIAAVVMIILAGLFVIARMITRIYMAKVGWDDAAVVVALASSILLSTMMCLSISNGYGMHKKDIPTSQLRITLKQFFVAQTPYKVTVGLNKIAMVLLYLRIFITRNFRIAAGVVLFILVGWTIASVGATIGQCVPISGAWDKTVNARCIDSNVFWVAYAVGNIITDVMVLVLPIPSILALKLSVRDKLLLIGIFMLGSFVTVTSIVRVTSVQNSLKNKDDLTYNFIPRGIWTIIEANLGTISTCLPVLKQPMGRIFPRIFGTTKNSSYYLNNGHQGDSNGFNLSNVSGRGAGSDNSAIRNHPGTWREAPKAQRTTSVSGGPEKASFGRKSDERYIFTEFPKESDVDRDSDLETATPNSTATYKIRKGIAKRVDLVRTSFHDDQRPRAL